jgi:hypothetical protein
MKAIGLSTMQPQPNRTKGLVVNQQMEPKEKKMKLRLVLLTIFAILFPVVAVNAQVNVREDSQVNAKENARENSPERTARRRSAKVRGLDVLRALEEKRNGLSSATFDVIEKVGTAYDDPWREISPSPDRRLTGTWYVTVPVDDTTVFHAFQTFGSDGTFVETSSLLGTLIEGPAHGVWENRKRENLLTFEVFEFDPDGNEAGRVRVRNLIRLTDNNHFTAYSVIDFIDLNGEITEGIATGIYTAERMQVRRL